MYKNILVCVDGSEKSDRALETACKLAATNGARLHLVHASNYGSFVTTVAAGEGVEIIPREDFEKAGKSLLAKSSAKAVELGVTSTEAHYVDDFAGKAIVHTADEVDADLIVIGSQGHGDIAGLILGSVSHKVCNSSRCSCLVVR